jgi:hypothetical protein
MNPLALVLVLFPAAAAEVKVEQVEYHGWADSYRLSNGTIEVTVVPKIGRVMRYGYAGKDNLLWENPALAGKAPVKGEWNNYGGDKVWPAPQSFWNWPPDPDLDGSAWTAEQITNGVRITSPVSKKYKLRFVREITLDAYGTQVHFRNRLDNLGPRREISPWQITQLDDPFSVFIPLESTAQNPKGWRLLVGSALNPTFHELTPGGLRIKRSPTAAYKFGTYSSKGEITASQRGQTVFHMSTRIYRGQKYPDGGSPLELFTSGDPAKYVEVELLGPLGRIDTGEGAVLETTWRLTQGQ